MKKKTSRQRTDRLRPAPGPEAGKTVAEICRELGISQQTFYRWRRKSRGMGVAELNRLKELERENKRLGAARP